MQRVVVAPKLPSETRLESIDVSSLLQGADILSGASATCAVYSGVDTLPSAVLGTISTDSTYNRVYLTLQGGVLGTVYLVTLTVNCSNAVVGANSKTLCFFLALIQGAA